MFETINKFNEFLEKLFESYGYEVEITDGVGDMGVDLVIRKEKQVVLAEVKAFRSKYIAGLDNSLARLNFNVRNRNANSGILIVSSLIDASKRDGLQNKYGVKIIYRNILFALMKDRSEFRDELEELLLDLTQTGDEDLFEGLDIPINYNIESIWIHIQDQEKDIKPANKGENLYTKLLGISAPKEDALSYEKICKEILRYLFDDDLSLWIDQNRTDDTLHRFDLIARISSINDFWKYLARDFKSRFIIFEFKNYTKPISQNQIYSTEKYLFTTALRSIAFLITRKGRAVSF